MRLLSFLAVLALLYFGHQYWRDHMQQAPSASAPGKGKVAGGTVRDWERAPDALMDMQDAMGGGRGPSARSMRDTVQRGLDRSSAR